LWDLALADVAALDRFEGLREGLYVKAIQPVIAAEGPKQAIVYIGMNAGPGRPRETYMRDILAAASTWRLPRDGMEALERLIR
jgi:hypothetical protein